MLILTKDFPLTLPVTGADDTPNYATTAYFMIVVQLASYHSSSYPPTRVATAPGDAGPPHYRSFTITLRCPTLLKSPLDGWSARRRDLNVTTHNLKTDVYATDGIRNHNSSKRQPADPRLRPRGHWERPSYWQRLWIIVNKYFCHIIRPRLPLSIDIFKRALWKRVTDNYSNENLEGLPFVLSSWDSSRPAVHSSKTCEANGMSPREYIFRTLSTKLRNSI